MTQTKKENSVPESELKKLNTPNLEVQVNLSKDGKWYIHKTIITSIKPVAYIQKVLESSH